MEEGAESWHLVFPVPAVTLWFLLFFTTETPRTRRGHEKNQKESSVKIRVHPCPIPGRPIGHGDHGEGA